MKQKRLRWLSERKLEAEEEVGRQSERVQYLQALYIQQENIIGGREGPRSTVERDMERLRSYKATLYSALLAWAESSRLVSAAAQLAAKGATLWESLSSPTDRAEDLERCFSVATGTRDSIHEAALCIGRAQAALPAVQFAYCTAREITAVNQILEYLYTDLQIADRYHYGVKLYTSFQKRAKALHRWIKKVNKNK
ncbi:hypothetical protein AAG570_010042 [Ranatra chinensis]|uniref:Uncharacterized protein n=1 Tax=Ranatra chinensis TaxID=642074 RepID=A0ABD0YLK2_9HEMI